ncbi:hypothetical protein B9479_006872 [Cryptococcus floricola]|uniref:DUF1996 domain-containing protein n=1 Tax=Cryptococcus floricola TaxID=2591691 RepID=A0A5D3ANW9_9TREE|nr:hypothetical protein B9479_006872 [Cryptococcus floricola]
MLALFGILALLGGAAAWPDPFWVVMHGNAIFTSRLDPIVSPGAVAGHVHSVIGGTAFNPTYSYAHSTAAKSTTANVEVDLSNYWVPQMYRKSGDGFELVKMNRVNTSGDDEVVYPFPKDFRMLAGDASRNTYNESDYTNNAISYVCLGVDGSPQTNAFPEQSCPDDLRAQVFFPNCWDGFNTWLEGSKHVAYPTSGGFDQGGPCPATHPKRIMSLFYEFHFSVSTSFCDFTNGWPEGYFEEIFSYNSTCNVEFSLENCPPLAQYFLKDGAGTVVPDDDAVIVDEDVGVNGTILSALPGNNPVWGRSGPKSPDASYVETGKLVSLADGSEVATSAAVSGAASSSSSVVVSSSAAAASSSGSVSNTAPSSSSPSSDALTIAASLSSSDNSAVASSTQMASKVIATNVAAVIESSSVSLSSSSSDSGSTATGAGASSETGVAAHNTCARRKRSRMNW